VLRVLTDRNRLLVEHVMMIKKHVKRTRRRTSRAASAEQESTIHVSNVMLVDGEGNKTRVGKRIEGERLFRYSKTSGQLIPEKKKA